MRTLLAPLLLAGVLAGVLAGGTGVPAAASVERRGSVDVIEVRGLVDDVVADFVGDALRKAEAGGAEALVLQIDSRGSITDRRTLDLLAFRLSHARVPVAAWVGPSGARAYGGAFTLVQAAHVAGAAPGARLGRPLETVFSGQNPYRDRSLTPAEAAELGVIETEAPTLGDFVVDLDGRVVSGRTLETAEVVREQGEDPRRRPTVDVRFAKLGLVPRLLHAAASPSVAYLLLVVGLALVVLELFTAGVGVAAATAVVALALSAFGLGALPTRPLGLALVVLGVFGYAVDVQAGTPRAWTVIGTVLLGVGSVRLFDGLAVPMLVLALVVAGTALFMVAGMPSLVRARFSTPTIGRESMVGELGEAVVDVDPEGTVVVRGARWPARTNRATPITAGASVRVVGIDGLLLEVEPEEGAARDYRRH